LEGNWSWGKIAFYFRQIRKLKLKGNRDISKIAFYFRKIRKLIWKLEHPENFLGIFLERREIFPKVSAEVLVPFANFL